MARLFAAEGWEHGQANLNNAWAIQDGTLLGAITGMTGSYCLRYWVTQGQRIFADQSEVYISFKYRPTDNDDTDAYIFSLMKGSGTRILDVILDGNGKLAFYIGTSINGLIGSTVFNTSTTYLIEVRFKMSDAGGVVQVKCDDVMEINYSGDTKPGADTTFDRINFGNLGGFKSGHFYIDDFAMDDANWIGPTEVRLLKPSGAGNSTQWSPSAGSNYQCVDENPYNDADYVLETVAAQKDLYALENLSDTPDAIKGVQVIGRVVKDGSPTPANVRLVTRTESTDYNGDDEAVPLNNPKFIDKYYELNPNTSSEWTVTQVNAIEIGIESRT
ncbi:MAG TPA: hypothetical protein VMZ29_09825 [Candidatus Bathyarchaeia archaeon]|nr:hypothetical protein [Candidatus Bathyarchaeia archaeon]